MKSGTYRPRLELVLAASFSFLLLGAASLGQAGEVSNPDADGGYTSDYSNIPRLEWRGPGAPGTYREYLVRRGNAPFTSKHLYRAEAPVAKARNTRAMVLVNTGLYAGIQPKLDVYVNDLVAEGYTVDVHQLSGGTHADLKTFIVNDSTDLVGVVLVGDQPTAWFEDDLWGPETFPVDLYLMDLDGQWTDSDSNGIYDTHSAGSGDVGPEIFVGHIDASMMTGNEAVITNAYLDKNHSYRTGGYLPTNHGLTYTEDDWAPYSDMRTDIQYAYSSFDDVPAPATTRDDYVINRIPDPGYEFIQLACHSWSRGHAFTRGGSASNSDVLNAPPMAIFYNLFCCSSARWTDSNYIGGCYVYDTGTPSLAMIGSSKTGSMLNFWAFYQPLGAHETFGEAFRQWFNTLAPYSADEIAWHYGMMVAGDPFLAIGLEFMTVDNVTVLDDTQDETTPRSVFADFSALHSPPITNPELYYRAGGSGTFSSAPMTLVSGDTYTADIPPFASPTRVEYYVRAEDGAGHSIAFPAGAPDETLSYLVGVITVYYQDGFETDTGWTHGMDANQDDWQRSADHGLVGSAGKAGDPLDAYEGDNIWGNDLGPSNWNGEYQDNTSNWLRSPNIDLTNATGATLSFARWLNIEKGSYDQAQVKVNGQIVWENPLSWDLTDTSWQLTEVDISLFDGNPNVELEFRLITDAGVTFGGWNIDDVKILSLGPVGGCSTSNYCTAKLNSQGLMPSAGSTGTPSVAAGDFEVTLTNGIVGNFAIEFWGDAPHDAPFYGGTLCVHAPLHRGPIQMMDSAGGASWPIPVTAGMVGTTRHYQVWFRDPQDAHDVGLTDGLQVHFCD